MKKFLLFICQAQRAKTIHQLAYDTGKINVQFTLQTNASVFPDPKQSFENLPCVLTWSPFRIYRRLFQSRASRRAVLVALYTRLLTSAEVYVVLTLLHVPCWWHGPPAHTMRCARRICWTEQCVWQRSYAVNVDLSKWSPNSLMAFHLMRITVVLSVLGCIVKPMTL